MRVLMVSVVGLAMLLATACSPHGFVIGSGNDFTEGNDSGNPMTIDDIVTDVSYPIVAPVAPVAPVSEAMIFPMHLFSAATSEYYHGRFMIDNGGNIEIGYCSFKIVKHTGAAAYFAEWTIHRLVEVVSYDDPVTVLVDSDFDMDVTAA